MQSRNRIIAETACIPPHPAAKYICFFKTAKKEFFSQGNYVIISMHLYNLESLHRSFNYLSHRLNDRHGEQGGGEMKSKSFCLMIGLLIACLFFCSCAEEPSREDPVNQPSVEESTAKELRFTDDPERLEKAAESVVKLDVYDRNNNKSLSARESGLQTNCCTT